MNEKEENKENAETTTSSSLKMTTTPPPATTPTKPTDVAKEEEKLQPREISTREAYFASLNEWVKHANISHNAMAMFPWYFMSSYPQLFSQPAPGNIMPLMGLQMPAASAHNAQPPLNANNLNAPFNAGVAGVGIFNGFGRRIINEQAQFEIINRNGGYEYIVAPFWKRAVAEIIDMIIILFLKVIVIFIVTNVFGYNLMIDVDKDFLNKAIDSEDFAGALLYSMDFLAFSSDLLAFEIATKLFVCLYEAILTTFFNGASIGKYIMGLSIKYVEAMLPLPNNNGMPAQPVPQIQLGFQAARVQLRALLFPAETPNFLRAFIRAVAKNIILSFLFPVYFLMAVFFKHNRTVYDIFTNTIVVETPSQPLVLRRPPQQQQQ